MKKEFIPREGDLLYTVAETAKILKVNTNGVYDLINSGLLPALKLGSLKVRRSTLMEFLQNYEGMDLLTLKRIQPQIRKENTAC